MSKRDGRFNNGLNEDYRGRGAALGGSNGWAGGYHKPNKPYSPPKKTAYASIIFKDRTREDYEDIILLSEYKMGEIFEEGDFDHWQVTLDPKDDVWQYPNNKSHVPAIQVDINDVPRTTIKNRSVATCAYAATNEYMRHWLGMELDSDDRDWYRLNSLCDTHGLPQKNSFTVIQQLIEPYELGISHIVVPRNSRRFDEYRTFITSLGCNPYFLVDGCTTNEEALEKMFPDEKTRNEMRPKMNAMWRFECRDAPLMGAINMRQFQMESVGHNGGSNYWGPRSKNGADGWHMSIKIDRMSNIRYLKPINLPKYEEYPGTFTPNYWMIKDAAGRTLREIESEINKRNNDNWNKTSVGSRTPLLTVPDQTSGHDSKGNSAQTFGGKILAYEETCQVCSKSIGENYVDHERACQWCGSSAEIALVTMEEIGLGYILVPEDDFDSMMKDELTEDTADFIMDQINPKNL